MFALLLLLLVGAIVWRIARGSTVNLVRMVQPALVVGGVGFAAGFFGPMIFAPGANQGPLLGILITGPLGFLGGLVYGVVRELTRRGE